MSILTITPKLEVFSKVPELVDALSECHKQQAKNFIGKVGKIFAKHKICEDFGICIVHRHFMMNENEILVHAIRPDKTVGVSIPWNVFTDGNIAKPSDESLLESYDLGHYEKKYILPDNWFFDESGALTPFEFRGSNSPTFVEPLEEFAAELYAALKEAGLEKVLGVRSLASLRGKSSWEITPEGSKANVTQYGKKPEAADNCKGDMIDVGFQFDSDGVIKQETERCQGHSIRCNHCYLCFH